MARHLVEKLVIASLILSACTPKARPTLPAEATATPTPPTAAPPPDITPSPTHLPYSQFSTARAATAEALRPTQAPASIDPEIANFPHCPNFMIDPEENTFWSDVGSVIISNGTLQIGGGAIIAEANNSGQIIIVVNLTGYAFALQGQPGRQAECLIDTPPQAVFDQQKNNSSTKLITVATINIDPETNEFSFEIGTTFIR